MPPSRGPSTWTGGTISGAAATTFTNDVAISGPNLKTLVGGRTLNLNGTTTWSGNTANNNNAIRFWNGATINNNGTFNDANAFASFIEHNVGGPHNFNNNGTYNKQSNTVTTVDLGVVFNNSGTLNVNAGTMRFSSGTQGPTGTVRVASGATFQHDAASTVGNMITAGNPGACRPYPHGHIDYDNANFGVGNAFNRRANVTVSGRGTPRLLAAGDVNQGLTGAASATATPQRAEIVIGNVHVGANHLHLQHQQHRHDRAGAARRDPERRQRRQHHRRAPVRQRRPVEQLGPGRARGIDLARRHDHRQQPPASMRRSPARR